MKNSQMPVIMEDILIEKSVEGRRAVRFPKTKKSANAYIPEKHLRKSPPNLAEISEFDTVRHFTNLSKLNYSLDSNFYPLGSCTMKYNPKAYEDIASIEEFTSLHPFSPDEFAQGTLEFLYEFEKLLCKLTGLDAFTLQPAAGAHGELVGVLVTKAYHNSNKDNKRTEILVPDSAHGTNPASASICGFKVVTVKSGADGKVDIEDLKQKLSEKTALCMFTVPNTVGLFETDIKEITALAHKAGALVYMDGANFNALIGLCKPADFGIDIMHINVHKTFSTPHGGGGPGAGPVGVVKKLEKFLPVPRIVLNNGKYETNSNYPDSIGMVRSYFANVGVLLKSYCYLRQHDKETFKEIAENAIINANYILANLKEYYPAQYDHYCMHECVLKTDTSKLNVHTLDIAKALLDRGFYAPTIYFPLIVPEALMIEPTETENKETIDSFINAMKDIHNIALENPDSVKNAPHKMPIKRLDEVTAARNPDICWQKK
ncbi:MAG TPA: aminomethyl-transferring glycine dehydrogenase subunit GcvPB [Elusimicrobiales bacterium]|nr:aminomethyl-transferring glycine dehydrogenase subunit GcvPB [Elusimicrobiales bacterium]